MSVYAKLKALVAFFFIFCNYNNKRRGRRGRVDDDVDGKRGDAIAEWGTYSKNFIA